jgi:hypothetical protein
MKITFNREHAGALGNALKKVLLESGLTIRITIDDVEQRAVIWADPEAGECLVFVKDADDKFIKHFDEGTKQWGALTELRRGKVRVEIIATTSP